MLRRALALAAVAVVAAACGGGSDEPESERAAAPALEGPLVYTRAGGFAGRIDRLSIEPDGRAELKARAGKPRSFSLAEDEMTELRRLVADADLASLPPVSTPAKPVPDAFAHRVAYGGRTVTADETTLPARFAPLAGHLSSLVDRHSRHG